MMSVRHLIVDCKSGSQREDSASFESLHEPEDAGLQTCIRMTARRDFEVAINARRS